MRVMSLDQNILTELKEKLLVEKAHLEEELSRFAQTTNTPGNYETQFENIGTDSDENASEVEEYVDNIALENNLESQLKDVTDALGKMEKGTYGVCEKTGEEISLDRLQAYPGARTAL